MALLEARTDDMEQRLRDTQSNITRASRRLWRWYSQRDRELPMGVEGESSKQDKPSLKKGLARVLRRLAYDSGSGQNAPRDGCHGTVRDDCVALDQNDSRDRPQRRARQQ